MYGLIDSSAYDNTSGFSSQYHHHSTISPLSSHSLFGEFNSIAYDAAMPINAYGSSSTGSRSSNISYTGSPCSPPSCCTSSYPQNSASAFLQRSLSTHSLLQNELQPTPCFPDLSVDVHPVTQVFNSGDLDQGGNGLHSRHPQHRGGSLLGNENVSVILQSMTKACRYSPDEKRERIQRYRTKRSRRTFNKKIQYECRKTLADSRPRIRGRFARNDETEITNSSADLHCNHMVGGDGDEDYEHWIYLLHSISSHIVP